MRMKSFVLCCSLALSFALPAAAQDDGKVVIGVAMASKNQPRWAFDVAEMQKTADGLGAELRVRWAVTQASEQMWQVESLIAQDVDALIVVAVDARAAQRLVQSAKDANIPVIAYDRAIPDADIDYFVTRDNTLVGTLQVDAALKAAPPDANDPPVYALIKGDSGNVVAQEIAKVYEDRLKPLADAGQIRIVADQWHPGWSMLDARNTAEGVLARGEVDAFVVSNDSMALGVANAMLSMGLETFPFVSGLDADPANDHLIVEGVITMTVWTEIDRMAREAVHTAWALAKGEIPPSDTTTRDVAGDVPTGLIEVVPVTADTMCDWILNVAPDGWATVQSVYGKLAPPDTCKGS